MNIVKEKNQQLKILDSDILFIYDAKMCNPNGDPDEENKPRMDYETNRNLVSDVRLKRYIRDYLISQKFEIWVSKVDDKTVDATRRLESLEKNLKNENKCNKKDSYNWLLDTLIDVRLFGATIPIKGNKKQERGNAITFTGPVQFTWGYSLNPVELVLSSSITSMFSGRDEEYGTIGKDWRVYYSLIAFYGIISSKRAEKTKLMYDDILLLDNALIRAIPSEATTRSKIGQTPRFLLRVEYKKGSFIDDLRRYVYIKPKDNKNIESLREVTDFILSINNLFQCLKNNEERINKIYLWYHSEISCEGLTELKDKFKDKIVNLPHSTKENV